MNHNSHTSIIEVIESLNKEGVKAADIARKLPGISERGLRAALKKAGYTFHNKKPKGWIYTGQGEEPLEKNIYDFITKGEKMVNSNSPRLHIDFTESEKEVIREMIRSWKEGGLESKKEGLHERVKAIKEESKKRGTIIIPEKTMSRLDRFCSKEKEDKSDVLHLAIIDFLDKYEKED